MNDADQISCELDTFAQSTRAFTFEELVDSIGLNIDHEMARIALIADSRFITLGALHENYFVPEMTLFQWFTDLSVRLGQAQRPRLGRYQLAMLMSSLRLDGRWDTPPLEAIQFGQRFGFIGPAWTSDQFVFPIARLLSLMPPYRAQVAVSALEGFMEMLKPNVSFEQLRQESVCTGFSNFEPKIAYVVQAREGLLDGTRMILEEIGNTLHLTRERVRQLEAKFWHYVSLPQDRKSFMRREAFVRPFLVALLCDVMARQGSLIVRTDSDETPLSIFLARCAGIPLMKLPGTKIIVLGALQKGAAILDPTGWFPSEIDAHTIATRLESEGQLCLVDVDLRVLAGSIERFRKKRLNKEQRVYLALQHIGKPAHCSEVTDVHNSLFPEHASTERNIHAALLREKHGVVWIGIRSTFALKEWSYERPSQTLFDTVTEIVEKRFEETSKPVPFGIIIAEIGKYRRVVRPSSLAIAAYCNPDLRRVYKDSFVPKDHADEVQEDISAEELDMILKEFERRSIK